MHHGLLEPCDKVPTASLYERIAGREGEGWKPSTATGWRFLRSPDWALFTNIPEGGYLAELPGQHIAAMDREITPWSVVWPDGRRTGIPERWARELLEQDRIERTPEYRRAALLLPSQEGWFSMSFVERDISELDIHRGDLLVYAGSLKHRPKRARGTMRPLDVDAFEVLRAEMEGSGGPLFTDLRPLYNLPRSAEEFLSHRRAWGGRLKVWFSRLLHVQPIREEVSEPVDADDDDSALSELVRSAGGTLAQETGS